MANIIGENEDDVWTLGRDDLRCLAKWTFVTAVCFGGATTTSATVIGLGDVISRNDDWVGENTVTNTNWSFNSVWASTPADGWQIISDVGGEDYDPMTWNAGTSQFVRTNANPAQTRTPVINQIALAYTSSHAIPTDQHRWAFADWTSEQNGLVLKVDDTNNALGFAGNAITTDTTAIVAYYDDSSAAWTVLHNTTGAVARADEIVTIAGGVSSGWGGDGVSSGPTPTKSASFGVPYTPKCLEWAFEIPIRGGMDLTARRRVGQNGLMSAAVIWLSILTVFGTLGLFVLGVTVDVPQLELGAGWIIAG